MNIREILDRLHRMTALRMTGIALPVRWSRLERFGPLWLSTVSLQLGETNYVTGFAVDRDRRILPIKVLMEALETLAVRDHALSLQSRTGMAAHFTAEEARATA